MNRLVAMDYRGGKNELFFVHAKAFFGVRAFLRANARKKCTHTKDYFSGERPAKLNVSLKT